MEVYSLNLGRIEGIFLLKNKINNFIIENNINIIHSHGLRPDIFSSFSDAVKISTLHNNPFLDYFYSFGKIKGYLITKIHLYFIKKFNYKISCSKSICKILIKKTNINFIAIQNGIEIKNDVTSTKQELRKKFGFSNDDVIFISIGVLNSRKDPLTIINAFNSLNKPNFKLLFLGDGKLFEICKQESKNKNIIFFGNVDNIYEYLKLSDYFISASLAEGLPNSVLEAMSCVLPCLLSDIPSHIEILNDDRLIKYLFNVKKSNELLDRINDIFSDDYCALSKISRNLIKNNFTAEIMSKNYENLYMMLIK